MNNVAMVDFIADEYKNLKVQRKNHEQEYKNYVYTVVPEIENIDNEIASLAITSASRVVRGTLTVEQAFEQMESRRDELNALRKKLLFNSGINEYQPLPYKCSLCKDTGRVNDEYCTCYKQKMRKYMIESAKHISSFSCDIENDSFANLSTKYYSKSVIPQLGISAFDYMKGIIAKCRDYCMDFGPKSDNLFFSGEPGRGKTYMANCIANELLSKGYSVIYQTSYRLFQFLEDYKFGKLDRESHEKTIKAIYDCDMLIIDDLGTEYITAYTCAVFFDVINSRLLNNKKTLISTNLSMGDMAKNYTERIASRIKGEFNAMLFIGKDIRVEKRNENSNGGK